MRKIILSMSLVAALFFVSCDQNSEKSDDALVQGSTLTYQPSVINQSKSAKSANLLVADCDNSVPGSAVVNRITGGLTGNYCDWTPTAKTIGTVNVQFEGIYGSGFRTTTSGWYVGVIDPTYECADGWPAIAAAISVKNLNSTTIGVDPSCGSFLPQNVVGAIGSAFSSDFGTVGYYNYSNRVITITKKVVIWKDATATAATANTTPSAATEAYIVEITSVVPTHAAAVFGTVNYIYTKVL